MLGGASLSDPFIFNDGWIFGLDAGYNVTSTRTQHSSILSGTTKTIITGGQSNMASNVNASYSVVSGNALNLNIYDGAIYNGAEPALGCDGLQLSSFNMSLADSIISRGKSTNVVVVPIAIGGSQYVWWVPTTAGSMYSRLTAAILRCRARGLEPDFIIWGEGETDNVLGTTAASIKASIWAIVDGIRAAPISCNAPFYVGLYTMVSGATNATIRSGISSAVDTGRIIRLGYDADTNCTVAGGFRQGDQTHFSATGRDLAATGWSTLVFP